MMISLPLGIIEEPKFRDYIQHRAWLVTHFRELLDEDISDEESPADWMGFMPVPETETEDDEDAADASSSEYYSVGQEVVTDRAIKVWF